MFWYGLMLMALLVNFLYMLITINYTPFLFKYTNDGSLTSSDFNTTPFFDYDGETRSSKDSTTSFENPARTFLNGSCRPFSPDPFSPSIMQIVTHIYNSYGNCTPRYEVRSALTEGSLTIELKPQEKCKYRALLPLDDWKYANGKWEDISDKSLILEDVIEVLCRNSTNQQPTYHYIHTQITPKMVDSSKKHTRKPFDVHVFVIDTMSTGNFLRTMSATHQYLTRTHGSILFPYLNRVGYNSKANALAMLFGLQEEELTVSPWGEPQKLDGTEKCHEDMYNSSNFVAYDFQKAGYATMLNEDSYYGITTYPNCNGFSQSPVDHWLSPFRLKTSYRYGDQYEPDFVAAGSNITFYDHVYQNLCKGSYHYLTASLEKFAKAYQPTEKPAFSVTWLTYLVHDDTSASFPADGYFKDFFTKNADMLDSSFTILLGDHGPRHGPIRRTWFGSFEEANPFLLITVPAELRTNSPFMLRLKQNKEKLVSQHDIYATLLELAMYPDKFRSAELPAAFEPPRSVYGSSLFHRLKEPRNCHSLCIPFEHCLCKHMRNGAEKGHLYPRRLAELAVERMNTDLKSSEFRDMCATLSLNATELSVYEYGVFESETFRMYKLENNTLIPLETRFPRQDMYRNQTKCMPVHFLQNYCYCRDLITDGYATNKTY